jgi:hypothetical protein
MCKNKMDLAEVDWRGVELIDLSQKRERRCILDY